MMLTKENLFEPSGCFTREAFEALVNDTLPMDMKDLAYQHLSTCAFCADALKGFTSFAANKTFSSVMNHADEEFIKISDKHQYQQSRKRNIRILVSMAASVIILTGLFILLKQPEKKSQMAEVIHQDTNKSFEKPLANSSEIKNAPKIVIQRENKLKTIPVKSGQNITLAAPPVISSEMVESDSIVINQSADQVSHIASISEPSSVAANELIKNERETNSVKSNIQLKKASDQSDDRVEDMAEVQPQFPGGDKALSKFIKENLVYPQLAKEKNITGKVIVHFTIEKDGKITDIKVIRGIGSGCDEEAVRVIGLMPKWKPAMRMNKTFSVYFMLPIKFDLAK